MHTLLLSSGQRIVKGARCNPKIEVKGFKRAWVHHWYWHNRQTLELWLTMVDRATARRVMSHGLQVSLWLHAQRDTCGRKIEAVYTPCTERHSRGAGKCCGSVWHAYADRRNDGNGVCNCVSIVA